MDGFRFSTDLTVRFSETDAQAVVHNAVYLVWFEIGRIAYLGRFPSGYKGLVEQGIDATTTEAYVRYLNGTQFDDELRIHVRATDVRGARFRFEYVIERTSDPPGIVADGLDRARVRQRRDAAPDAHARLARRGDRELGGAGLRAGLAPAAGTGGRRRLLPFGCSSF